jgi:hypothetical protein
VGGLIFRLPPSALFLAHRSAASVASLADAAGFHWWVARPESAKGVEGSGTSERNHALRSASGRATRHLDLGSGAGPTKAALRGMKNAVFLECPAKAARIGGRVRAAFVGAGVGASSPVCLFVHLLPVSGGVFFLASEARLLVFFEEKWISCFRSASDLLPKRFRNASESLPLCFRNASALLPVGEGD